MRAATADGPLQRGQDVDVDQAGLEDGDAEEAGQHEDDHAADVGVGEAPGEPEAAPGGQAGRLNGQMQYRADEGAPDEAAESEGLSQQQGADDDADVVEEGADGGGHEAALGLEGGLGQGAESEQDRGEHEPAGGIDGQVVGAGFETGGDGRHERLGDEDAERGEGGGGEEDEGGDAAEELAQGFGVAAGLDLGVDGDDGREQGAAGQQHEDGVGNAEGGVPGVGFGSDAELGVDGGLADEAEETAEGDGGEDDAGGGGDASAEAVRLLGGRRVRTWPGRHHGLRPI